LVLCGVVTGLALLAAFGDSHGKVEGAKPWTKIELAGQYSFVGDVLEDKDLSGLALVTPRFGLLGADETRAVQVVELSRSNRTLRVAATVPLVRSGSEIDIEAIAAEGDYCYIIGSHGASKKKGEQQDNRHSIFRLRMGPFSGKPAGRTPYAAGISAGLQAASLDNVIRADPVLGVHFGQPLQRKGVNIEGLAIRQGQLFVGFRSPNLDGGAFVMEIRAADVFDGRSQPPYVLHKLPLGAGLGIREMAATKTGFLIIAGNAGSEPSELYQVSEDYEEDRGFFLVTWDGKSADVHQVGALPKTDAKAEAMVILEETEDSATVLILSDGPRRGRPTVYRIS
jgi:hypothetical protein